MESALSVMTTMVAFSVCKVLSHRRLCGAPLSQWLPSQHLTRQLSYSRGFLSSSVCASAGVLPVRSRTECVSSSASSFASGGGSGGRFGGDNGGGGGGGENGSDGGDATGNLVSGGAEEVSALSPDVIILNVGGMTCGGCAASVKKILESQPQVSSASVNLVTETAMVWPVSEAKVTQNWQQQLGEALANHLTSCGFKSNFRVAGQGAIEGEISP